MLRLSDRRKIIMASFGELVLVLGDLHIPERAHAIPESFKRMLVPNKMKHILCTGNISREQYNDLCQLAPSVHVVRGDFDNDESLQFPESSILQVGQFRIGLIHGHQLLPYGSQDAKARLRRTMNVDILVSGHTHQNEVVLDDGHYFINPGSITGAYSSLTLDPVPSFILLAIQDTKLVCYVYELGSGGEVEVSKTEFTKAASQRDDGTAPSSNNQSSLMQSLLA
ncbi:phosphodiesterase MJ0936 family protein [Nitzschia inconspicua]|uniref:Vacuolar protein sorting-associated protein 29 n=1 Tax=Nitzschia inconspicua TaxID=303405 RepID=A0A9K3PMU3_9STRA|nr:phosphodiesterase MJ0936 family protein [Nitzschia inconspicua]